MDRAIVECDLLRGSFIPPEPIRTLRSLTRYRKKITEQWVQEIQRLQDVLQDAGIKLSSVASNVLGASGRAMIEALVQGRRDPEALAALARGSLRGKKEELRRALEGHFATLHAFLAEEILGHLDYLEGMLERLNARINESLQPYQKEIELLQSIPGVKEKTSPVAVAELGVDMQTVPTSGHADSWAGLCPVSNESAGKLRIEHLRKRNGSLRPALVQAAWAAVREDDSYLAAQFHRLAGRTGKKKAILAVAHSILVIAYHVLKEQRPYHDLGTDYFLQQKGISDTEPIFKAAQPTQRSWRDCRMCCASMAGMPCTLSWSWTCPRRSWVYINRSAILISPAERTVRGRNPGAGCP